MIQFLVWILLCVSPITTEVFAPAMNSRSQTYSLSTVETSVSLFLLSVGVCHLLHGWLIDKIGEYIVTLYGLLLYTVCSCLVATKANVPFLAIRLLQGLGASACTVGAFAYVRRYLHPAIHLPRLNACRSVALIFAPMISDVVIDKFGWRAAFLLLCAWGVAGIVFLHCAWLARPSNRNYSKTSEPNRRLYWTWTIADGFGFASMFMWISYAPFLEHVTDFGLWYGLTFVGSAVGSLCATYTRPYRSFLVGSVVILCTPFVAQLLDGKLVFFMMTVSNFARGLSASHAQSQALMHASTPGKGSGIMNAFRMCITAVFVALGIRFSAWYLIAVASSLAFLCVLTSIAHPLRIRKRIEAEQDKVPTLKEIP